MKFGLFFRLTVAILVSTAAHADLVVKDDTGQEVRLKAPARRIVTLAPHAAESLYAAGAGDNLVGTVDYSDYPPEAKKVPRVGGYSRIDLEAVAALKPDLVLAWESGNNMTQVDKLRALGLTVYVSQPNTIDNIANQIERLGQLAGTGATANATAERFRQRLDAIRMANASKPKVRVFYQIWKTPLLTVGGPQIISDAIKICGGENIFGHIQRMAPNVTVEAVLEADPEAIIATGMGDARPEWLHDWDKWARMTAVKRDNLFHINPDIMQRHTPRILDGTEKLCAHLDVARSRRPAK
ncbi:MAG: cobalamin-binding protein [Gammaproteobacteria bacterium]|nr:cobalamin-binding protein [Gammaproteobacteria bacterium]MBU1600555.1 cobalamin-binding protein [Gammaproteobacteria bacterium]MBU2435011.1 cobalamin-binding protein [Gammaproteobacteria bacterium]MBU2448247.1 cobalamin-binding protein [Gammaproteobacteria bacterium]